MKKILDKLDDDIDFLFTRGKRANERCYDLFIRTITFLILALIVLCYGSFVHASTSVDTNDYDTMNQDYFFTYSELNEHYSGSNPSNVYPEINSGFLAQYPPLWTENRLPNFQSQISGIDLKNDSAIITDEYHKYYALFLQIDSGTDNGICRCNLISIYAKDIPIIINDGKTVFNAGLANWYIYSDYPYVINNADFQVNYSNQYLPFQLKGNNTTEVTEGGLHAVNGNVTGYLFGCDCNIYSLMYSNYYDGTTSSTAIYNTVSEMVEAIKNTDTTNKPFNLNPKVEEINPPEVRPEEVEGNANHMYFQNVKMGLTAQGENNNLSSSSLVVGCEVDDYIKNHMSEYKVYISCEVHYKDSVYTKNSTYGELLPLSLFYNQAYVKGLSELFSNMPWDSPYANFYSYYRHLGDDYNVFTKNVSGKNGTLNIPTLIDILKFTSGFYQLDTSTSHVPNDFNINTFQLDVSVVITDSDTFDTKSGVFTQRFDFLNGNTSILKADALVNENPWEGVSEPTADPFPNGSAGGSSNGSVVQNNNQTVNVNIDNGFSVVNGGADGEDYDNTIDNIRNLLGEFKNGIGVISEASVNSETGQPNGFLGLLESTYSFIPGMNYFVIAIAIICALAVILFIIKVLLF